MVQTGKSGSNMAYFLPSIPLNKRNAFHRVRLSDQSCRSDVAECSGVSPRKKGQEIHSQEETGASTSAVEENLVSADLLLSFIFRRRHCADSFDES